MSAKQILIISHDVVDSYMAGPGIRYWELARVLACEFSVKLAVPGDTTLSGEGFDLLTYATDRPEGLAAQAQEVDVVLAYGYAIRQWPFLTEIATPWVADVYVPEPTEALGWHADEALAQREQHYASVCQALQPLARRADFFICANERQRDFWLGLLAAYGRLNPRAFAADPTLRRLVDIVPLGLPAKPPRHRRATLKGVWPGIQAEDQVVLWGGGLWDWLDPLTLLRAMAQVIKVRPHTRLVFPGTRHPNVEQIPDMAMRRRVEALIPELGLEAHVFSGNWFPYAERENYLLEADVGVSLHFDTVETRFAFRTRLLDYFWAGLPMVVSRGDTLSELVTTHGLGYVVDCDDAEQVAQALLDLLAEPDARQSRRERFKAVQTRFAWERVAEPLLRFCREPRLVEDNKGADTFSPCQAELERQVAVQAAQIDWLQRQIAAYEQGRFIRFMAWLAALRQRGYKSTS